MNDKTKKSIAESLETEEILIPHMPYLLQDFWDLGSAIEEIINAVGELSFAEQPPRSLDLGCGKGAVSIRLASRYGFRATGIDAMPEFLEDAKKKAVEHNVSDRCTFIESDIHEYILKNRDFDLVILASLGGILGKNSATANKMRSQICAGGYILIDDGFLKSKARFDRKGYSHYRDYEVTKKELTSFGDSLIKEISTSLVSKEINEKYLERLSIRAEELGDRHRELKKPLREYLDLQIEECEVLEREIEGMIWILKKK